MAKNKQEVVSITFGIVTRPVIAVPHRKIDLHMETVQGQEHSVEKLFQDYVLGRLDPRQLGGGVYDEDDADEVDPMNSSGLTYEEATAISDAGRNAAREIKQRRTVADHPIESSQQQEKEKQPEAGNSQHQ